MGQHHVRTGADCDVLVIAISPSICIASLRSQPLKIHLGGGQVDDLPSRLSPCRKA